MKRTSHIHQFLIGLAIVLPFIFGACTHNNGDIGIWFGTWHVEKITHVASGEPVATYHGTHFMQFQSSVIRIVATDSLHNYEQSFGVWDDATEGLLNITFPDSAQFQCSMPGIARTNIFIIEQSSDTHITLSHAGLPDDEALRYSLTKLD